jgi:hypothetical protein
LARAGGGDPRAPAWRRTPRDGSTAAVDAGPVQPVAAMGSGIGLVAIGVAIGWLLRRTR